ncbi:MAG: lipoprotein transmembrane [Erythrobacteraceae bacterium]|nr:MAG: lipoprotein transmembrane [Erythrobacteraceae bacterium]
MILAGLAACATPFKADVSRFQSQLPAPQGESYAVVADDPALAGGLEFAQYADLVEAQMTRLGYTQAASVDDASLLVRFDYTVDKGRERVRSTGFRDPFYSPWYGYTARGYRARPGYYSPRYYGSHWGYGFNDPWFGGPEVRSYTVYTSGIDLKIDRAATGERLFEGEAQAVSTSNRLQYLVPNLVEAMFTDFPGNSGETVRISIAPEKTTVRRIED